MTQPTDPGPSLAQGSLCGACGAPAVVQWRRRPTSSELTAVVAVEEQRRAEITALADPDGPTPVFGPLPTAADVEVALHACVAHAITATAAALVHAAACTAPNVTHGCDCTPEPMPPGDAFAEPANPVLPAGW